MHSWQQQVSAELCNMFQVLVMADAAERLLLLTHLIFAFAASVA
jgi:hypothetical protein